MENNFVWDEDKLNKLRKLWDDGLPITKIGNEIGVSRNAIAGKAHRMGLPKRNSPISKSGDPRKNHETKHQAQIKENEDSFSGSPFYLTRTGNGRSKTGNNR